MLAFGLGAVAVSFLIYALASLRFDAGRPDFFYLADAFLHGRFWLDHPFGPWDNVIVGDRVYVPVRPVPGASPCMPLVALFGPATARPMGAGRRVGVGGDRRWPVLVAHGPGRRPGRRGADLAGVPVRLQHPDPVGDDPRRRVAHGPPHRRDGHARGAHRDIRSSARLAPRAAPRGGLPDPGAARPGRAVLRLGHRRSAVTLDGPIRGAGRGDAGCSTGSAIAPAVLFALWYNAVRFGSPLESGLRASRRCRRSSRSQRRRACSRWLTSA